MISAASLGLNVSNHYVGSQRSRGIDRDTNKEMLDLCNVLSTSMFEEIAGPSEAICRVTAQVMRVAPSDATVLITGESGTEKELIARAIHKRSRRSRPAFTRMNCAVIPPSLIAPGLGPENVLGQMSSVFQIGGPRSMQFALRLRF
jgi:transcriptional regulator with PAS, ATPase and Fis domain